MMSSTAKYKVCIFLHLWPSRVSQLFTYIVWYVYWSLLSPLGCMSRSQGGLGELMEAGTATSRPLLGPWAGLEQALNTLGVGGGHVEILRHNAAFNKGHINRMDTKEWAGGEWEEMWSFLSVLPSSGTPIGTVKDEHEKNLLGGEGGRQGRPTKGQNSCKHIKLWPA